MSERRLSATLGRAWPWLVLVLSVLPSIWWVRTYETDVDPEFTWVVRPTFSRYPPAAYRLADAGDTIDHIAVYVASAALVLAGWGWIRNPRRTTWAAAFAISGAGFWHAATPGPLLDGWYGLGWRTIFDHRAGAVQRIILLIAATCVATLVLWALRTLPVQTLWRSARRHGIGGLLCVAIALVAIRQVGWLDREPIGFWPRWVYVWGVLAWALALARLAPKAPLGWWRRRFSLSWWPYRWDWISPGAVFSGTNARFIGFARSSRAAFTFSAMPTYDGLKLAYERHHFRTIINLFPELTPEQSPHWPDELRFVREHGLKYVGNTTTDARSGEEFVAQTIDVARDPASWPVLVHCHASMDRSPAWVGVYRFVVQGWPLADAIRELEWHRGLRPRGSVTLLYISILPQLAPERAAHDPTLAVLRECAAGKGAQRAPVAVRFDETKRDGSERPSAVGSSRR